jgi:IS30 family transposase
METKHHTKLSAKERDLIAVWRGGGVKIREIARRLGRSPGTISDEIKRNNFDDHYVAIHAQALTERRKAQARRRCPLKDKRTYSYVLDKLMLGWSPEQIAGRLELEQGRKVIHHETIYQFVYSKENKHMDLWEYLPRKQKRRKKQHGRGVHRAHIPQRVSIHQRPEVVNARSVFGHWEGDTVEGKGHKDGIHTEAERLSRKLAARIVAAITSEAAIVAQKEIFSSLPQKARRSTTLDNGRENHLHFELKELDMDTYFADPYSSWQRGTNEYHNGLIRRYLPKGTSFTNLTQEELDDIVWEINNRPRKVLNFYTAEEIFNLNLGVRIPTRM